MGSVKKYLDAACRDLNSEHQLVAPRSWFRVDVPRGGSSKHADPYWFSPDGFRFRSVKEIDRWREAGWDLGAMPRSALQGKKFDGLGVSQEEALKLGVITPEQLERIRVSGGARAGGGAGPGKRRGGGDGSEDGEGARRRRRGDDSQAASAEGRSMQEQARAGLCMKTVSAIAPMQAQPVVSIYQKKTWIGDLKLTHFIGVDMRCVLPKDMHVYQRTVYDAVVEFAAKPFMQLAGDGAARDGDSQFRGVVMLARCEALPPARDDAGGAGGASRDGLETFFKVLHTRKRVGFCQTLDNNHQVYIVPRPVADAAGAGAGAGAASSSAATSSSFLSPAGTSPAAVPAAGGGGGGAAGGGSGSGTGGASTLIPTAEALDEELQKLIAQAQAEDGASAFPRGEDALLVMVLRNLDGANLCNTPGVGELEKLQGAQQVYDASSGVAPPARDPKIPVAPCLADFVLANAAKFPAAERDAAAAFQQQQLAQRAAAAAAQAAAAQAEADEAAAAAAGAGAGAGAGAAGGAGGGGGGGGADDE